MRTLWTVCRTISVVGWKILTAYSSAPELCSSERRRLVDGDIAEAQLFTRSYRFRAANLQLVRVAGSQGRASKLKKSNDEGGSAGFRHWFRIPYKLSAIRGQVPVDEANLVQQSEIAQRHSTAGCSQ